MLRLLGARALAEICGCSRSLRRLPGPLPGCHRLFSRGSPAWKGAVDPGEKSEDRDAIDLDKWKSLMSAKALPGEKRQVCDDGDGDSGDGHLQAAGAQDPSSLGAIRDLVVMWRQAGKLVPEEISDEELQELAALTTKSSRKKYLKFLAVRESHKESRKRKQQEKRVEREARLEQRGVEGGGGAEKWNNTFLLQYWDRSMDRLLAWNSAQAMQFNQPLVFDMSYDANMSRQEIANTVQQLMEVEGWNRRVSEPYHLHFCNLQEGGAYMKELRRRYGDAWDQLLVTCSHRQHVDLFPREQLVYLTADSRCVLQTYDHSKVYIIGAMVDRSIQSGLSLANAKRLNIATARLPLSEYLKWETGAKNLTLDQMIRIMVTFKDTGNWEEALKFVPRRKHDGFKQQQKPSFTNDRHRRDSYKAGENNHRSLRSGERIRESVFKSAGRSLQRPQKDRTSTSRDRKMWWEDA